MYTESIACLHDTVSCQQGYLGLLTCLGLVSTHRSHCLCTPLLHTTSDKASFRIQYSCNNTYPRIQSSPFPCPHHPLPHARSLITLCLILILPLPPFCMPVRSLCLILLPSSPFASFLILVIFCLILLSSPLLLRRTVTPLP